MALRMHPYGCGRKAIWVVEVYDRGDSFSHRIRDSNQSAINYAIMKKTVTKSIFFRDDK